MGNRRRSRELALQTLYALDRKKGHGNSALVEDSIQHMKQWAEEGFDDGDDHSTTTHPSADVASFAERLIRGVVENLESIDAVIGQYSTNWKVPRMALVDRNVLRVAAFELLHVKDIPPRVSLNEAIEVAKRYGSNDSGAFINGILDRIAALSRK